MIGGVVLAGVVLGSVVAQTGYHAFEKQVSETQGELTADSKDALPDQKTIEANKKKNETERKQEEQQEQEDGLGNMLKAQYLVFEKDREKWSVDMRG